MQLRMPNVLCVQANNSSAVGCSEGWNTACGNLDMETLWYIVFLSVVIFIVVLLPYAIYYYEADDGEDNVGNKRWLEAFKLEFCTILVAVALIVVLFVTSSTSKVPMKAMEVNSMSASHGFRAFTGDQPSRALCIPTP